MALGAHRQLLARVHSWRSAAPRRPAHRLGCPRHPGHAVLHVADVGAGHTGVDGADTSQRQEADVVLPGEEMDLTRGVECRETMPPHPPSAVGALLGDGDRLAQPRIRFVERMSHAGVRRSAIAMGCARRDNASEPCPGIVDSGQSLICSRSRSGTTGGLCQLTSSTFETSPLVFISSGIGPGNATQPSPSRSTSRGARPLLWSLRAVPPSAQQPFRSAASALPGLGRGRCQVRQAERGLHEGVEPLCEQRCVGLGQHASHQPQVE